jgi:hypothetical protein
LGDATFAEEVYADIRDQAVAAAERWHDVRMSIKLAPSEASKPDRPLLITTVHKEFVVTPSVSTRRFICTSDPEEYRELAQDAPGASAWFLSPTTGLSADTQAAFELLDFSVDGEPRTISRTTRRGSQIYTATIGKEALEGAKPVVVAFTYRTLTAAFGHLLYFDIEQPSRDVAVSLDYDGCGIAGVSVLDFIASSQQARIVRSPSSVPNKSVAVEFDGWAFPRSGVAFVWVLEYEFKRHVPPKPRGSPPGSSACRETLRIGPHGRQSPIRHGAVKAVFA